MLSDKVTLVTGGTGSLGTAVVRHILDKYAPKKVVVFSRGERAQVEMKREFNDDRLRWMIGDVRDEARLARAMLGVDYVIHCAALKHVDVAEYNPEECIKTNILGSMSVVAAALASGVQRVVAISTDKACNPSNLYGSTKLCADKLFLAANVHKEIFSVVQFGNIAGSSGSVIPLWKKQRETGTITITDPLATRFWITPLDAAKFIIGEFLVAVSSKVSVPEMCASSLDVLAQVVAPGCKHTRTRLKKEEKLCEEVIRDGVVVTSDECMVPKNVLKAYLGDICA